MSKVILINPFEVPQGREDECLTFWEKAAEYRFWVRAKIVIYSINLKLQIVLPHTLKTVTVEKNIKEIVSCVMKVPYIGHRVKQTAF